MNRKTINKAVAEAKRFLAAATAVYGANDPGDYLGPSKHTGAFKRASMDLTRALADLRRPG